ncbi:MAG: alpha-amylase [bacterium]|nr:alpha-amylase [bacterium]
MVAPESAPIQSPPAALRLIAAKFNDQLLNFPSGTIPIRPGDLITAATITDILRYVLMLFCHEQHPKILGQGLSHARSLGSSEIVELPPPKFVQLFPPPSVLAGSQNESEYLGTISDKVDHLEVSVGEMILLELSMENPAFLPFRPLYDDQPLRQQVPYMPLITRLEQFFATQPTVDPVGLPLFDCLRAPMLASPFSLEGQLEFIRTYWSRFLPVELVERTLLATDILREQAAFRLPPTGGPVPVMEFWGQEYRDSFGYPEPARFSPDADWMSNVVMIAKSTYVWLDQLSKRYGRDIHLLSDIPDEELDRLARFGFTALWLIGVWERSPASQQIKRIMGNPEAVSSAYSLYDYTIAADLGGDSAYDQLRQRAWQRGIRLASDMVPNHMGIYSRWSIEHPDWFMQLNYPPFPAYRFTGANLSWDPRVTIQIEDGYWNHTDAAVVFKRTDNWTGDVRYIYHGNDGTSMPWNDTAQLNFMIPDVREAVIQTILHVARHFPIIRFDAAMTLAKKHYQRLWFPQPGDGGAIPSRAEHGMTRTDFDAVFPEEFWRQVVDRVAAEVPDTLLLAEAFWLMEGYFVRTLGMHRVYNSAFMNMLKMEENANYRQTVKNVLTFSPEVIKRFVNFMNNPDERTAVEQFGRGDKYFGVAMLMVTMPGLPMFGHGQIEGFTEKYGMEYRRAYWDEHVDEEMVRRHQQQIFPLMHKRYLFSGAANFAFFDFVHPDGWVDENVYAFTNRAFGERALILYNNAYSSTNGTIHTSSEINVGQGEETHIVRRNLADALDLNTDGSHYYLFRDHATGLEYIRNGRRLQHDGFWTRLHAYQFHAFIDWREMHDSDGSWAEMERRLDGGGVPNIDEAHYEMKLEPILTPLESLLHTSLDLLDTDDYDQALADVASGLQNALTTLDQYLQSGTDDLRIFKQLQAKLEWVAPPDDDLADEITTVELEPESDAPPSEQITNVSDDALVCWSVLYHLLRVGLPEGRQDAIALQRMNEWRIVPAVTRVLEKRTGDLRGSRDNALLVWMLIAFPELLQPTVQKPLGPSLQRLFDTDAASEFLRVNRYQEAHWFNREQFDRLISTFLIATLAGLRELQPQPIDLMAHAGTAASDLTTWADRLGYQVEAFLAEYGLPRPPVK